MDVSLRKNSGGSTVFTAGKPFLGPSGPRVIDLPFCYDYVNGGSSAKREGRSEKEEGGRVKEEERREKKRDEGRGGGRERGP